MAGVPISLQSMVMVLLGNFLDLRIHGGRQMIFMARRVLEKYVETGGADSISIWGTSRKREA